MTNATLKREDGTDSTLQLGLSGDGWQTGFDWMMPEAWNVEHNNRHHYNLSEIEDPDLVENNLADLREMKMPLVLKYFYVLGAAATWKWFYYSPNTYKELKLAKWRK